MSEKIDSDLPSTSAVMGNCTQIVDLNDYYLEKVFSYLEPIDFYAVKTAFSARDRPLSVKEVDLKFEMQYAHQRLTFRPAFNTEPASNKFGMSPSVLHSRKLHPVDGTKH